MLADQTSPGVINYARARCSAQPWSLDRRRFRTRKKLLDFNVYDAIDDDKYANTSRANINEVRKRCIV